MTEIPNDENGIRIPMGWTISPSTLKSLQEATEAYRRFNEMAQNLMQNPMKDLVRMLEAQREQQEAVRAALKAIQIPNLDFVWLNKAASTVKEHNDTHVYLPRSTVDASPAQDTSFPLQSQTQLTNKLLLQLIAEQRRANDLKEAAMKRENKDKKKTRVLILDRRGHFFLQGHKNRYLDLSKSAQKRNVVMGLKTPFTNTSELFRASGCKSMSAFYKLLQDLKEDCRQSIGLKTDFFENDPKKGYRLTHEYRTIIEWEN